MNGRHAEAYLGMINTAGELKEREQDKGENKSKKEELPRTERAPPWLLLCGELLPAGFGPALKKSQAVAS